MKEHITKFFQFVKEKEGKDVSLKRKLLNQDIFTFSKEDLTFRGDLYLNSTNVESLPAGLTVYGDLNLGLTRIKALPSDLTITGNCSLYACTSLTLISDGLRVGIDLNLSRCKALHSLPRGLDVGGDLNLFCCTSLKALPDDLRAGRDLTLYGCTSLNTLPNGLSVGGNLDLINTPLAKMYSVDKIRAIIESKGGYVDKKIYS